MDLIAAIRSKIDTLPPGDYSSGLRAVLVHIERAFAHLERGQLSGDEDAFTDAIYRTNQAFEGSIKEAYRVLAGQDPTRKTPFQIEQYVSANNIFTPRVIDQFSRYRTEWRNPSAHDYMLRFNDSEAFLAIAAVASFACVLIDQISERLAFSQSERIATPTEYTSTTTTTTTTPEPSGWPCGDENAPASLAELVIGALALFNTAASALPINSEKQLIASVHGFLSKISWLSHVLIQTDVTLVPGRPERVDLIASRADERVLIEVMRGNSVGALDQGLLRVEHYMALGGIKSSVLYLQHADARYQVFGRPFMQGFVHLLVPVAASESEKSKVDTFDEINKVKPDPAE